MDDETAFGLIGKTVSLIIDGTRVDGVFVKEYNVAGSLDLLLPTKIGQPNTRR